MLKLEWISWLHHFTFWTDIKITATGKLFLFALSGVTQVRMGFLLSLGLLKVFYLYHLRDFFLATVASGFLIMDKSG